MSHAISEPLVGVDSDNNAARSSQATAGDLRCCQHQDVRAGLAQPWVDQLPEPRSGVLVLHLRECSVDEHGPAAAQARFEILSLEGASPGRSSRAKSSLVSPVRMMTV